MITRTCLKCHVTKPTIEFHRDVTKASGLCPFCRSCVNARKKSYRKDIKQTKALNVERSTRQMQSLRIQALLALGDKCVECGANDRRILHIDHIDGKGHKERKKAKRGEMNLKIINGDTENYQLLCANCHAIKTWEQRGYRNPNQ